MKIGNVMHRDVEIIGPKESLRNAAAMMKKLDAGALPVGEHDKLVGMITDRDIAIRGIAEGNGPDATIQEVMSTRSNTTLRMRKSRTLSRIWPSCSAASPGNEPG